MYPVFYFFHVYIGMWGCIYLQEYFFICCRVICRMSGRYVDKSSGYNVQLLSFLKKSMDHFYITLILFYINLYYILYYIILFYLRVAMIRLNCRGLDYGNNKTVLGERVVGEAYFSYWDLFMFLSYNSQTIHNNIFSSFLLMA